MTPDLICGIDPGGSGGISLLDFDGRVIGAYVMPETERETLEILAEFAPRMAKVTIERLQPMLATSKATMFKLGRSYGFLRGLLTVLQVPFDEVQPKVWQKTVGCIYPAKSKHSQRKAINRQKAQQLWPAIKVTDETADSLLLAEYGRRNR